MEAKGIRRWVYLGHYTTEKEAHLKYIWECSKLNGVGMI